MRAIQSREYPPPRLVVYRRKQIGGMWDCSLGCGARMRCVVWNQLPTRSHSFYIGNGSQKSILAEGGNSRLRVCCRFNLNRGVGELCFANHPARMGHASRWTAQPHERDPTRVQISLRGGYCQKLAEKVTSRRDRSLCILVASFSSFRFMGENAKGLRMHSNARWNSMREGNECIRFWFQPSRHPTKQSKCNQLACQQ